MCRRKVQRGDVLAARGAEGQSRPDRSGDGRWRRSLIGETVPDKPVPTCQLARGVSDDVREEENGGHGWRDSHWNRDDERLRKEEKSGGCCRIPLGGTTPQRMVFFSFFLCNLLLVMRIQVDERKFNWRARRWTKEG